MFRLSWPEPLKNVEPKYRPCEERIKKWSSPQTRDFKRESRGINFGSSGLALAKVLGSIFGVRGLLRRRFGGRFWEFGSCFGEGTVWGSILGVRGSIFGGHLGEFVSLVGIGSGGHLGEFVAWVEMGSGSISRVWVLIGRSLGVNFGSSGVNFGGLGLELGNIRGSISRVRSLSWDGFGSRFWEFGAWLRNRVGFLQK